MIRKRRKVVNGVEITLMEKTVSANPMAEQAAFYNDIERRLTDHIENTFHSLPTQISTATTKEIQTVVQQELQSDISLSGSFDQDTFLGIVGNTPEEGSILAYDDQGDQLLWQQSPSVRFADIENTLVNYNTFFRSDFVQPNKLHLPFAVAWGENNWGGNGRGGIFWSDPWTTPVDNFSIKFGHDDEDIGESGYTDDFIFATAATYVDFGGTGFTYTEYEYDMGETNVWLGRLDGSRTHYVGQAGNSGPELSMKFSQGSEFGRGWSWTRVGSTPSPYPVMSLTNRGLLKVDNSYVSIKHSSPLAGPRAENKGGATTLDVIAPFHIVGYDQDKSIDSWSGQSIISITKAANLGPEHDGYVLTYEHNYLEDTTGSTIVIPAVGSPPYTGVGESPPLTSITYNDSIGHIRLRPATGGGVSYLSGLTDVQLTEPIGNNEVLAWNTVAGKWINSASAGGGGGSTLPGVEIDMGGFIVLDQPAQVDCGSFV